MSCSPNQSRIKFIHNLVEGPAVDILIDDQPFLTSVEYKTVTTDFNISSKIHNVKVYNTNYDSKEDEPIFDVDLDLAKNQYYTAVIIGNNDDLRTIRFELLIDEIQKIPKGKSAIRFFNAASSGPIDAYIGTKINLKNYKYGDISEYFFVDADVDIEMEITLTKSRDLICSPFNYIFNSGVSYIIITTGIIDDELNSLTYLISKEGSCNTCVNMNCKLV
jgi:hypothetical protein